jgi:hypothetical protein
MTRTLERELKVPETLCRKGFDWTVSSGSNQSSVGSEVIYQSHLFWWPGRWRKVHRWCTSDWITFANLNHHKKLGISVVPFRNERSLI